MKKTILFPFLLAFALSALGQVSDSFIKNSAKKIWSNSLPAFNAQTPIPDSLLKDNSAIIIAEYHDIDAGHEQIPGMKNSTKLHYTRRFMVKLLDQSAIDHYSEFEFGDKQSASAGAYEYRTRKNAFGARIHKNGEVKEVDLTEAFKITEGKKGDKETGRKIAIPGLEIGDVLEYFYYVEDEANFVNIEPINIGLLSRYPVLDFTIVGAFDEPLTVEYRTANGCPEPTEPRNVSGRNLLSLNLKDLPLVVTDNYTRRMRQLPIFRISILNNQSPLPKPGTYRRAGLYGNLPRGTYIADAKSLLNVVDFSELPVKRRAKKLYNNYAKAHPEASKRQLIDAAFVALQYAYLSQNRDRARALNDIELSALFNEILKEVKLAPENCGLVAITSKNNTLLEDIITYSDPTYATLAGDSLYLFTTMGAYAPGEMPASIQGETGVFINTADVKMELVEIPAYAPRSNSFISNLAIIIDPEGEKLNMHRQNKAIGSLKGYIDLPIEFRQLVRGYEDFLGIAEKDRFTIPGFDEKDWQESFTKTMKKEVARVVGSDPVSLNNVNIESHGLFPSDTECRYSMDCTFDGLVENLGGDVMVHVGKLFGTASKVEGKERDRQIPAFLYSTYYSRYEAEIDVPEGYKADEKSLEEICHNTTNALGQFFVMAKEEDGKVKISVLDRRNTFFVPVDLWPMNLALTDANADFIDATIIFTQK